MLVLNSDFRTALVRALSQIDELEEGHLTIEQFAAILTQLIGVNGVSLSTLLVGRYRLLFYLLLVLFTHCSQL